MNNKYKLLVIEDETNIRSFVKTILDTNGYQVLTAGSVKQGLLVYSSHNPDLVLLDLGLPDEDGMHFIKKIRQTDSTPVIVLSARTQEKDKVTALDCGANDYITKPFGRRSFWQGCGRLCVTGAMKVSRATRVSAADTDSHDLEIDYARRLVRVQEKEIKLTQTEYNIVALLSQHAGRVLTYASIIQAVWAAPMRAVSKSCR